MFDFDLSISAGKVRRLARELALLLGHDIGPFGEFVYLQDTLGLEIDWLYEEDSVAKLSLSRVTERLELSLKLLKMNQRGF